ncbi:MAG: hypothetical protein ACOCY0_03335, partial [Roseicyclus sp.]
MTARLAAAIAARGRWMLVAGLALGLGWPAASEAMRPAVGPLVVALLFLAMLRIGPAGLRIGRRGLGRAVAVVALLQCGLPVALALAFGALGLLDGPFALGALMILAAAPITGAAHIAAMAGGDPAPGLRLTVIGTALLPLTVVPVFALAPAFGDAGEVIAAVLRLLLVILAAGGVALALHRMRIVRGTAAELTAIDATAALLLGACPAPERAGPSSAPGQAPPEPHVTERAGAEAHGDGYAKSFAGGEAWAERFDDPKRDAWQKPAHVVELMALKPGARVADLHDGGGGGDAVV